MKVKCHSYFNKLRYLLLAALWVGVCENAVASLWWPSSDEASYRNPIIYADYSDPDVIRANGSYYLVSSSFNVMPGIPVLKSDDLVHWEIVSHVYPRLPLQKYNKPVHGQGSWAPSIRFHNNEFYVYFCTPHDGLFVAKSASAEGPWKLEQVESVELWEDPAPFWDDDGQAYLIRSKVRADNLYLHKLSPDGTRLLDDGVLIFRDIKNQPVIEGPKLYKKDGWYYIFAPAGGVKKGWQAVLRSRKIYGPYQAKTVMHQGSTDVNGPHQGGLVQDDAQNWWFIHYQDQSHMGRVVHLQPVSWRDGWPVIGQDDDGDGIGEPVATWSKPIITKVSQARIPQTSDDFSSQDLGLQWQWHANPDPLWYQLQGGQLRLNMVKNPSQNGNLYFVPNLLLQKFPSPEFTATTKLTFKPLQDGDKSGLVVMGRKWGYIGLYRKEGDVYIGAFDGNYEQYDDATLLMESKKLGGSSKQQSYFLRVAVEKNGHYQFSYSTDGNAFSKLGKPLVATPGVWIGTKVGLFALNPSLTKSAGFAKFDWFQLQ